MRNALIHFSLIALFLFGCSEPDATKTFSGQIFITLANRETLKMSLVPIAPIPDGQMLIERYAALKETNRWNRIFFERAKLKLEEAKYERDQAASARGSLRQSIWAREDENKRYAARKLTRYIEQNNLEIAAKKRELETVDQRAEAAEKALTEATEKYRSLQTAEIDENEKSRLWSMIQKFSNITTDADGNFSFTTKGTNEWWIAAYATREVKDFSEDYLWIVKGDPNQKMQLNNLNEISSLEP